MARIELYKAGHNSTWPGICEYDHELQQYKHHEYWPERTIPGYWMPLNSDRLRDFVIGGHWVLMDPDLALPEGF